MNKLKKYISKEYKDETYDDLVKIVKEIDKEIERIKNDIISKILENVYDL